MNTTEKLLRTTAAFGLAVVDGRLSMASKFLQRILAELTERGRRPRQEELVLLKALADIFQNHLTSLKTQ